MNTFIVTVTVVSTVATRPVSTVRPRIQAATAQDALDTLVTRLRRQMDAAQLVGYFRPTLAEVTQV